MATLRGAYRNSYFFSFCWWLLRGFSHVEPGWNSITGRGLPKQDIRLLFYLFLILFLYSLGEHPKWALTYFPKKERFGKFIYSEISLMDLSECLRRCSISLTTYWFIQPLAVFPLIFLQVVERYFGVTHSSFAYHPTILDLMLVFESRVIKRRKRISPCLNTRTRTSLGFLRFEWMCIS